MATFVFLLSDTAWLMPGRYSDSEVINHATRAAQGFTSIQMTAAFPEHQRGALSHGELDGPLGRWLAHHPLQRDGYAGQCAMVSGWAYSS